MNNLNNHWGKILQGIIAATVLGTMALLWRFPFQNAQASAENKVRIEVLEATNEERWVRMFETLTEMKLRQERIEAKVDAIGFQK